VSRISSEPLLAPVKSLALPSPGQQPIRPPGAEKQLAAMAVGLIARHGQKQAAASENTNRRVRMLAKCDPRFATGRSFLNIFFIANKSDFVEQRFAAGRRTVFILRLGLSTYSEVWLLNFERAAPLVIAY
jgi:hypothetical protein